MVVGLITLLVIMSKFNLRILLAIVVGIIQVVVRVLSEGGLPSDDTDDVSNIGGS